MRILLVGFAKSWWNCQKRNQCGLLSWPYQWISRSARSPLTSLALQMIYEEVFKNKIISIYIAKSVTFPQINQITTNFGLYNEQFQNYWLLCNFSSSISEKEINSKEMENLSEMRYIFRAKAASVCMYQYNLFRSSNQEPILLITLRAFLLKKQTHCDTGIVEKFWNYVAQLQCSYALLRNCELRKMTTF